ncbi:MAG TPA: hypothetical protein VH208_13495, partial [Myxococcaceae bacterium]|nr:hypothetical protein [Myxococcaceae bacterium]
FPRGARAVHAHLLTAGARRDFLGDCAGAIVHFRAIARDRSSASQLALIGEARCLRTLGRDDQARSAYAQYLAAAPHGRYALEARAQTQTVTRRTK